MSRAAIDVRPLPSDVWCDANAEFADASGYRDFDLDPSANAQALRFPVLLELEAPATVADLRAGGISVPAAYPGATRFATAWLDEFQYTDLRVTAWGGIVARWMLQLPVVPLRAPVPMPPLQGLPPLPVPARAPAATSRRRPTPTVIGVIDSGCPFADPRYLRQTRRGSTSRIRALWDQTDGAFAGVPGAVAPREFGRGAELLAADIDAWLATSRTATSRTATRRAAIDENACYRRAGYEMMPEGFVHGAAVLDLAAGPLSLEARYPSDNGLQQHPPRWSAAPVDAASQCDIVFVQVARNAVDDSTSASLPMQLLDGLRYILARSQGARRVIVNISDGTSRALHDGHSILEDAITDLQAEIARHAKPVELTIVVASGNAHVQARHAVLRALKTPSVPAGDGADNADVYGADVAVVHLPVANEQAAFLNVAMPANPRGAHLVVTPPAVLGCPPFVAKPGEIVSWKYDGQACFWLAIPPAGQASTLALAAWSPTAHGPDGRRSAPAGDWRLQLVGRPGVEAALWVSLAQKNRDVPASIRQARFVDADAAYDPWRWMRPLLLDLKSLPPSVIRRVDTMSVPATMEGRDGVVAAGASLLRRPQLPPSRYFLQDEGSRSPYSSIGAAPGIPATLQPADAAPGLAGIRGAGSPGGQVVGVTGTSFAAPQAVRKLA